MTISFRVIARRPRDGRKEDSSYFGEQLTIGRLSPSRGHGGARRAKSDHNAAMQRAAMRRLALDSRRPRMRALQVFALAASLGETFSDKVHVSAIWAERDGKWLYVFSQESSAR